MLLSLAPSLASQTRDCPQIVSNVERFTFADWAETCSGVAVTAAFGAAFLIVLAQVYSVLAS